jgi:hypothetical protein
VEAVNLSTYIVPANDVTFYAIYKKPVTVTFNGNNNKLYS